MDGGSSTHSKPKKPVTRAEREVQRVKWREAKRISRLNMTGQKRRRINEKRRATYADRKQNKSVQKNTKDDSTSNFTSDSARRKAVSRIKSRMPSSPRKFSVIVSSLINNATPRKRKALKENLICSPDGKKRLKFYDETYDDLHKRLDKIKTSKKRKDILLKRTVAHLLTKSAIRNSHNNEKRNYDRFGLSRKIMKSNAINNFEDLNARKKRKDAFNAEKLNSVEQYFSRSDYVRPLPCLSLAGKDAKVKNVMECSLKRIHMEYNSENDPISYSKFVKLKPKTVLPMSKSKFINCLCEYCVNIELSIDALRSFTSRHRQETENENRPHEATENENQNENQQPAVADVQENETVKDTDDETVIIIEENIESDENIIIVENGIQEIPRTIDENSIEHEGIEEVINLPANEGNDNANNRNDFFRDKFQLSSSTLCEKDNLTCKKICIDRKCVHCGTHKLDEKLLPFQNFFDDNIKWASWERTKYKNSAGKESMRMMKVPKEGSFESFVLKLKQKLEPFAKHLFDAKWQAQQFRNITTTLPDKWVVFCLDFAENFSSVWQDEAQGAHWSYDQVTIHPVVAYYRCTVCTSIVEESILCISADHTHDNHAVQHYVSTAVKHLLEKGINIEKLVQFSDGAPTQYKGKMNFADLSYSYEDFGFQSEKHYFGSRHGKGPCDREIGTVKKSVVLAIKSRRAEVSDAKTFHEYCNKELNKPKEPLEHVHFKRTCIYIPFGEINRNRAERQSLKAVKQTRMYHSYRCIQKNVITHRERSCFCMPCITLDGICENEKIVGKWIVSTLEKRARRRRPNDYAEEIDDQVDDGDQDEQIDGGQDEQVHDGGQDEQVHDGGQDEQVHDGGQDEQVHDGGQDEQVDDGGQNEHVDGGQGEQVDDGDHDEQVDVGHDEQVDDGGQDEQVDDGGQGEKVDDGDNDEQVDDGDHDEQVDRGQDEQVDDGDHDEQVDRGQDEQVDGGQDEQFDYGSNDEQVDGGKDEQIGGEDQVILELNGKLRS
ncbi:Hypothetical predicted protein [Mytilus galloprovincialis]|nr:Hypothetical predicted protein [Mytilus galloprovincialis]